MTSGFAAFARSEWNDHVSYAVQHGEVQWLYFHESPLEAVYQRFKTTRRSLGYATSDPVIPSKGMMARRMSGAEAHLLGSKEFAILQLDVDMQRLFERGLLEFKPGCKFCCLLDRNILREATLSFSTISVKISEEGDAAAEACPLAGKWVFFSPQNAHELATKILLKNLVSKVKSLPDEPHCYFSDLHLCVYAAWLAGGNKGSDIKIERVAANDLPQGFLFCSTDVSPLAEFWVGPRLTPKCSVITCTLALIQQGKPESVQMQFQQVYIDKRRAALAEQIAGLKAELAACEEELSSVDKSDPSRGQKRESQGGPSSKDTPIKSQKVGSDVKEPSGQSQ